MTTKTYIEEKADKETQIRDGWFKNHKAYLSEFGDIKVLEWREPDTIMMYVRYVFDGSCMYVSGDLGEAVFRFTVTLEKAPHFNVGDESSHWQ